MKYTRKQFRRTAVIFVAGALIIGANGSQKTNGIPTGHTSHYHIVNMKNMVYIPVKLTITAGDTVVWNNIDNVPHTVTADNDSTFKSGLFENGKSYQYIFKSAGKYPYHCLIHPMMKGTITAK